MSKVFLATLALGILLYFGMESSKSFNENALNKNSREMKNINAKMTSIEEIEVATALYYEIYHRYPTNTQELINKGLLRSSFKTSKNSKDISVANGQISMATDGVKESDIFNKRNNQIKNNKNSNMVRASKNVRNSNNAKKSIGKIKSLPGQQEISLGE